MLLYGYTTASVYILFSCACGFLYVEYMHVFVYIHNNTSFVHYIFYVSKIIRKLKLPIEMHKKFLKIFWEEICKAKKKKDKKIIYRYKIL